MQSPVGRHLRTTLHLEGNAAVRSIESKIVEPARHSHRSIRSSRMQHAIESAHFDGSIARVKIRRSLDVEHLQTAVRGLQIKPSARRSRNVQVRTARASEANSRAAAFFRRDRYAVASLRIDD